MSETPEQPEPDAIRVSVDEGVAEVVLAHAARRNALGLDRLEQLLTVFGDLGSRRDVDVIVLGHEGPAFSAGHDLAEMQDQDADYYERLFDRCIDVMEMLHQLPQPVIARVDGVATAAGCQLVASCDLVVATETSSFATPGVRVGLFCSTPMVALSRAIGQKRSMQMLLTGEAIDAATAADWGLVNIVTGPAALEATVAELAATIRHHSPHTIALGKRAFYDQLDRPEDDAYALTKVVMAANAADDVAAEGRTAFLSKRPPEWPR